LIDSLLETNQITPLDAQGWTLSRNFEMMQYHQQGKNTIVPFNSSIATKRHVWHVSRVSMLTPPWTMKQQ